MTLRKITEDEARQHIKKAMPQHQAKHYEGGVPFLPLPKPRMLLDNILERLEGSE